MYMKLKDGKSKVLTFSYDDGVVTTNPTCTAEGVKTFTCTCGDSYTEAVAATGHDEVLDPAVTPTCTEPGKTAGSHCSKCNTVFTAQETVPASGHTYNAVVTDPTCTTAGYSTFTRLALR